MTTTHTQLKLSEIALMLGPCLYHAENDFYGITEPPNWTWTPFEHLPAERQQVYYRRAELCVLSGIGYLDAKARSRAVQVISTDLELFGQLSEDGARLAEEAMSRVLDEYEAQLMRAYQEQR